jgi:hypothetical protein
MSVEWNTYNNILTVRPGDSTERHGHNIVAVIDTSGSMMERANIKDKDGKEENTGYSVFDLVKYTLKILCSILDSGKDRLSIVTYNNRANLVVNNSTDFNLAAKALDYVSPGGCTNMWDGVVTAFNQLDKGDSGRRNTIMVFTDGYDNIFPPYSYDEGIDKLKKEFKSIVHTYAFGNSIGLDLLQKLNRNFNGTFNYISDPGMIGTVFINSIANILSEAERDIVVNGKNYGSVRYGQPRHIALPSAPVNGISIGGNVVTPITTNKNDDETKFALELYNVSNILEKATNVIVPQEGFNYIRDAIKQTSDDGLLEDLTGELTLGFFNEKNFKRWGKFYSLAMLSYYRNEWCGNFRDKGIQRFGTGALFNLIKEKMSAIFESSPMPPPSYNDIPVASVVRTKGFGALLSVESGCFSGGSLIRMSDSSLKRVDKLVAGDILYGNNKVEYIMISPPTNMMKVCNGLEITPWHPVIAREGEYFTFPKDRFPQIQPSKEKKVAYNLYVGGHHFFMGHDNLLVAGLGHGDTDHEVLGHQFFGDKEKLLSIMEKHADDNGVVTVNGFLRDPDTGLVIDLVV